MNLPGNKKNCRKHPRYSTPSKSSSITVNSMGCKGFKGNTYMSLLYCISTCRANKKALQCTTSCCALLQKHSDTIHPFMTHVIRTC
jgi:hypothetical protein